MKVITPGGAASGSMCGTVASTQAGRVILRKKVVPVYPSTMNQQQQVQQFAVTAHLWSGLSPTEKAEWLAYGASLSLIDPLGQPYALTGISAMTLVQFPLVMGSGILPSSPQLPLPANVVPSTPDQFTATSPSVTFSTFGSGEWTIDQRWLVTDGWITSLDGWIEISVTRPAATAEAAVAAPWRLAGVWQGAALPIVASDASTVIIVDDVWPTIDTRYWVRLRWRQIDRATTRWSEYETSSAVQRPA
jgi:hypothetical protein